MTNNDASNVSHVTGDDDNTGASKGIIASAVVVAAIVVLGLVISLTNLFGGTTEPIPFTSTPQASVTDTASPASAPSEVSVCGLSAVEMSGTVNAPPTATWVLVGTMAAPSVTAQGPGRIDEDGFRSCYARTPTGALLSASNYVAMVSSQPTTLKSVSNLAANGPGRDYALSQMAELSPVQNGLRMQVAGFQIVSYTGRLASVDLAFRTSSGPVVSQVIDLTWEQGDWKIRYSDVGNFLSPAHALDSLRGYISWSGA